MVVSSRPAVAVLALCCVFAIATASTSLDAAVTTDPDDVVDLDLSTLPIGTDQAEAVKQRVKGENTAQSSSANGGESARSQERDASQRREQSQAPAARSDRSESRASDSAETSSSRGQQTDPPTLWERLLAFLAWLLGVLRALLPFALLAGALAAAYRYRGRLAAWLGVADDDPDAGGAGESFDPDPDDEVAAAWVAMIDRLEVASSRSKTPREYVVEAVRNGSDPDAVRGVTEEFEAVRYAGAEPTADRARRAREHLARLRGGARSDGGASANGSNAAGADSTPGGDGEGRP